MTRTDAAALIVIDVQAGFDDPSWGPTTNYPDCENNIAHLLQYWQTDGRGPIIIVQHDSPSPQSPLHAEQPGNALKDFVAQAPADLLIRKQVNSAFHGEPDLHQWLTTNRIKDLVICGIQTNMCIETTARVGGNLGYRVTVPWDATRTFDLRTTVPGLGDVHTTAREIIQMTALNLQGGRFAVVTTTDDLMGLAT